MSGPVYPPEVLARAARVRLAVFDVDGVLTDGRLYFDEDGREFKAFHARDGLGLKLLVRAGVRLAIISGRRSRAVTTRMAELRAAHVLQGIHDKGAALEAMMAGDRLPPQALAYVGDDLIDLPAMARVGLAVAVADADPYVAAQAHWVTQRAGGSGAAREVVELILAAQGRLASLREGFGP